MHALLRRTHARTRAHEKYIFPSVDPLLDGPDCLHDCSTCTVSYPRRWSVNESDALYGHVRGWATHVLVATGKTDWRRDVADERGSVMEAMDRYGTKLRNGRCMVSACNMPVPEPEPEEEEEEGEREEGETRVLVLPKWEIVEHVAPARIQAFMEGYVSRVSTTMSPTTSAAAGGAASQSPSPPPDHTSNSSLPRSRSPSPSPQSAILPPPRPPKSLRFRTRPCPHRALILLCSQKTRDARCGQSAPLLRREFERHLRPLGMYRDLHDDRPGGVGIYFISHVGGHKYSANVMVYRRGGDGGEEDGAGAEGPGEDGGGDDAVAFAVSHGRSGRGTEDGEGELSMVSNQIQGLDLSQNQGDSRANTTDPGTTTAAEAVQCIWLARVRPEDCEAIIKYTVLQGKVVKPDSQLRGGFDRTRGLTSW